MEEIILRPDSKGRINLGELAKGVSSYRMTKEKNGEVILRPFTEIPFSEKWIFEDEELLEKVKQHLKEKEATQTDL